MTLAVAVLLLAALAGVGTVGMGVAFIIDGDAAGFVYAILGVLIVAVAATGIEWEDER